VVKIKVKAAATPGEGKGMLVPNHKKGGDEQGRPQHTGGPWQAMKTKENTKRRCGRLVD
jgi:hypothetical protein